MSKGTPSMGKRSSGKSHVPCRRCGRAAYNMQKSTCASCGYGKTTRLRTYTWAKQK